MNIRVSSIAAGLLLLAGAGAAISQDVVIAPEQETAIREYVVKQKTQSVQLPSDAQVTIGATLPDTIELHSIDVPDVKYRYVVVGDQTVLVEPETRKIVRIIQ